MAILILSLFACRNAEAQWLTNGNVLAGGEKLGSTNNFPLDMYINNGKKWSVTTGGDFDCINSTNGITFQGNNMLFTKGNNTNLCVGITAGNAQGTTQGNNTFAGYQSGYNTNGNAATTVGIDNTFIGCNSAFTNTASCNNVHGYQALYKNTSGYANVAFGVSASYSNTTGAYNIAIGDSSLQTNTTGG